MQSCRFSEEPMIGVFRDVQGEGKLVWPQAAPFTFFGVPIFFLTSGDW